MTQQQALQYFLPVLIILPLLYRRMRKMTKAQPLRLGRLWIRPAIILVAAGLVVFLPQPGQHVRHFLAMDWAWLALAAGLGGVAGWHWGRTMAIEVHPEDGTLMVKGGMTAVLVLNQARNAKGELVWARPLGDVVPDARATEWCDKQVKFDPDLWIVEIEDREGRAFVDEPIV